MRKTKMEKGITLIALIITIVVLLILASVAISSIQNDGILRYAQNAVDSWNKAQATEANMLGDYLNYLNNMESGNSSGNSDIPTVTPKVGQYVEYDVSYTDMYQGTAYTSENGWRYLGTESGTGNHLLISTAIPVVLLSNSSDSIASTIWWDKDTTLDRNVRATNGLINNFAKIPYTQKVSGTTASDNEAIGRFVGKEVTVDGTTYTAIGDTFKSSTYSNKIENVRITTRKLE